MRFLTVILYDSSCTLCYFSHIPGMQEPLIQMYGFEPTEVGKVKAADLTTQFFWLYFASFDSSFSSPHSAHSLTICYVYFCHVYACWGYAMEDKAARYVSHLRRKSSEFSRGASMYRGVTGTLNMEDGKQELEELQETKIFILELSFVAVDPYGIKQRMAYSRSLIFAGSESDASQPSSSSAVLADNC